MFGPYSSGVVVSGRLLRGIFSVTKSREEGGTQFLTCYYDNGSSYSVGLSLPLDFSTVSLVTFDVGTRFRYCSRFDPKSGREGKGDQSHEEGFCPPRSRNEGKVLVNDPWVVNE